MGRQLRMALITIVALIVALAQVVGAAGKKPAVKTIDPRPVMILTGYSEAQKFSEPRGVFVDKKRGDIWVADSGNHQIVGFDPRGVPFLRFRHMTVHPVTGETNPGSPLSIAVDSAGQVFVTDGVSEKVAMYDYRGRLIKRIDVAKILGVDEAKPIWLDVDGNDSLYIVGDSLLLTVLNRDQELVRTTSLKRPSKQGSNAQSAEKSPAQSNESITAMDIGSDGKIYLLNPDDSPCVRVLDSAGKEVLAFGDIVEGWDNFRRPSAIVGVDDGTFWVADGGAHVVKQYAADGKFQQYIGGGPGSRPGEMRGPAAVATDGKEKLCVAERGTNRIQIFLLKS